MPVYITNKTIHNFYHLFNASCFSKTRRRWRPNSATSSLLGGSPITRVRKGKKAGEAINETKKKRKHVFSCLSNLCIFVWCTTEKQTNNRTNNNIKHTTLFLVTRYSASCVTICGAVMLGSRFLFYTSKKKEKGVVSSVVVFSSISFFVCRFHTDKPTKKTRTKEK
jgi:Na+/melibiose symporter-like transporter